jgi:hypothetical protein
MTIRVYGPRLPGGPMCLRAFRAAAVANVRAERQAPVLDDIELMREVRLAGSLIRELGLTLASIDDSIDNRWERNPPPRRNCFRALWTC